MDNLLVINMILVNGMWQYLFFSIYYALQKRKPNIWILILSFSLAYLSTYESILIFKLVDITGLNVHIINQVFNILENTLFMLLLERKEIKKTMFYTIFTYLLWYSCAFLIDGYFQAIALPLGILEIPTIYRVIITVSFFAVANIICHLLFRWFINRYHITDTVAYLFNKINSFWKLIMLYILITATLTLLVWIKSDRISDYMMTGFTALFTMLILFFFLRYCDKRIFEEEKVQMNELILAQQNMYIENLEEIQRSMRILKHDYANMISSLYLQAQQGNIAAIEHTMQNLLLDFDENIGKKMNITNQLMNIKVIELKSILLNKITEISHLHIPFQFEVLYPVDQIGIPSMDLSRALGIILDNAIEEVKEHNGDIILIILKESHSLYIRLENSVHHDIDMLAIFKENHSTKGTNRGLGLYSYQSIIDQYTQVISETKLKENRFIQEIRIDVQ